MQLLYLHSFLSLVLCVHVCACVSGIMMCCSAVKSWTAGLRTCLCLVLSGCLDFSTHSPSSPVTHISCIQIKVLPRLDYNIFSTLPSYFLSCVIPRLLVNPFVFFVLFWLSSGDAVSGAEERVAPG